MEIEVLAGEQLSATDHTDRIGMNTDQAKNERAQTSRALSGRTGRVDNQEPPSQ